MSKQTDVGISADRPRDPYEEADRLDLRHLFAVVWKWRILVGAGVLFVLAATVFMLRLTEPLYSADQTVVFDQPGLVEYAGAGPVEKLNIILPTYARIANSDLTLTRVQARLGTNASLADLRGRLRISHVPGTLALSVQARDANKTVAESIANAATASLIDQVNEFQERASVPEAQRYLMTPLDEVRAVRPSQHEARTLVLAAVLAFSVMAGVAFLLEYVERS